MTISQAIQTPRPFLETKLQTVDDTAEQIIEAFSSRAKVVGIRSIAMGELARSLRISTKTLYKNFSTKKDLVHELVVRWEARIHKPISDYPGNLIDILRYRVKVWVDNDAQFSTAFWVDLKSDYPQFYKVYVDSLFNSMTVMKARMTPYLKEGINHEFAWSTYFVLMSTSSKPKTFERLGMTREQCIYQTFDFWLQGAVDVDRLIAETTPPESNDL